MSKPAALNSGVKITATKGDARPPQDVQGRAPGAPPQEIPAVSQLSAPSAQNVAQIPSAQTSTVTQAPAPKKAGEKTELNPLSFKLRPELDREFRRAAFEADLKLVDFFEVVFKAWKDQQSNR